MLQNGVLFVFHAGLCILALVFQGLCTSVLSQVGLREGSVSQRCSLSLGPLPREFSAVLSSLEVTVWRRKAGKGPHPVSLLVPPWQFLLWEICENRRLFSSHNKKITVVPDTSVEHIIERSLCALLLFLYLCVDFVQPRETQKWRLFACMHGRNLVLFLHPFLRLLFYTEIQLNLWLHVWPV